MGLDTTVASWGRNIHRAPDKGLKQGREQAREGPGKSHGMDVGGFCPLLLEPEGLSPPPWVGGNLDVKAYTGPVNP